MISAKEAAEIYENTSRIHYEWDRDYIDTLIRYRAKFLKSTIIDFSEIKSIGDARENLFNKLRKNGYSVTVFLSYAVVSLEDARKTS